MYTLEILKQDSVIQRFWPKVNKDGPTMPHMDSPCWVWIAHCNVRGYPYGRFSVSGTLRLAHRVSWELHNNALVPSGIDILHKCDNPPCVNPEHLFLGTHTDNMRDMICKNRWQPTKGEANNMAKLTQSQVDEIRIKYATGKTSQNILAREYGVTQAAIWYILHRRNWR